MQEYLLSERRKNLITTVKLDILKVSIVTKHKYFINTCVLCYIGNIFIVLDFRPIPMYTRNYHNDAKHAIKTNCVSVSDEKIPVLHYRQLFSSKICDSSVCGEM
jgi:hypothetical protein